jgi:hypothetical protein
LFKAGHCVIIPSTSRFAFEGELLYIIISVARATSVLASAWRGDTSFDREAGGRRGAAPNLRL